jgi:hypothetical protein
VTRNTRDLEELDGMMGWAGVSLEGIIGVTGIVPATRRSIQAWPRSGVRARELNEQW